MSPSADDNCRFQSFRLRSRENSYDRKLAKKINANSNVVQKQIKKIRFLRFTDFVLGLTLVHKYIFAVEKRGRFIRTWT